MQLTELGLNRQLYKQEQDMSTLDSSNVSVNSVEPPSPFVPAGSSAIDVNQNTVTVLGDKVRAGSIDSTNYLPPVLPSVYSASGTSFDLNNGSIISKQFTISSSGNATFAGSIVGGSLNVPDLTSTNSWHVDSSGNMWSGTNASNFASAPFRVTTAGVMNATGATFSGSISSTTITGGNINGSTITGGIFQTASSGHRVYIDGANDDVRIYNSSGETTILLDGSATSALQNQMKVGGLFTLCADPDVNHAGGSYSELYSGYAGGHTTTGIHTVNLTTPNDAYFFFNSTGDFVCDEISVTTINGGSLSGNNSGDQSLSGYAQLSGATFTGNLSTTGYLTCSKFLNIPVLTTAQAVALVNAGGLKQGSMYLRTDGTPANVLRICLDGATFETVTTAP